MKKPLLLAAAIGSLAAPAGAVTVVLDGTAADPLGTRFIYGGTYAVDPQTNQTFESMIPGSRFIIFDFAGYVAGTITSGNANMAPSIEMTSTGLLLPPGFVDDPTVPNLVFTWIGPAFTPPPDYAFTGYSAVSIYPGVDGDATVFSSLDQNVANGTPLYMQGHIAGPVALATAIPEPTTWAMMVLGFGMVGIGMHGRRRPRLALA